MENIIKLIFIIKKINDYNLKSEKRFLKADFKSKKITSLLPIDFIFFTPSSIYSLCGTAKIIKSYLILFDNFLQSFAFFNLLYFVT